MNAALVSAVSKHLLKLMRFSSAPMLEQAHVLKFG